MSGTRSAVSVALLVAAGLSIVLGACTPGPGGGQGSADNGDDGNNGDNGNNNGNGNGGNGQTTIGASGGTASSGDGQLEVTFPADVLAADTTIAITRLDEGRYQLDPAMTFDQPVAFGFEIDQDLIVAALEGVMDDEGNPIPPESVAGLAVVFLDGELLDGATTVRDEDGRVFVRGELSHFSVISIGYPTLLTLAMSIPAGPRDVGTTFETRFTILGVSEPFAFVVPIDDESQDVVVTSLILNDLTVSLSKDGVVSPVGVTLPQTFTIGKELVEGSVGDRTDLEFMCDSVDRVTIDGVWTLQMSAAVFGEEPRTVVATSSNKDFVRCEAPEADGGGGGGGVDVMVQALASESTITPFNPGALIPLACITGGSMGSEDEPGCDCDHIHGTITVEGLGSHDDPNMIGCGHGCIVTVRASELDFTCEAANN